MQLKFSRRQLLVIAATAAGTSVTHADPALAGDPIGTLPSVNGVIRRLAHPAAVEIETVTGSVLVKFLGKVSYLRDNKAATFDDYLVGDHVIAVLRDHGRPMRGIHMESRFGIIDDAVITAVATDRLETTKGNVFLPADCLIHPLASREPLPRTVLAPGVEVAIATLFDPALNDRVARDVALES